MAWERVYGPVGPERWDIYVAMICQTIANANRDPKKQPIPLEKFMPQWGEREEDEVGDDT